MGELHAPVLVLANAVRANQSMLTAHLPLQAVRGQMTRINSTQTLAGLTTPVCAKGYILPRQQGGHWLGATYHPNDCSMAANPQHDRANIQQLAPLLGLDHAQVLGHWVGIRAATPDYLPLVGPVTDVAAFNQRFAALRYNAKRVIVAPGVGLNGLYVCSGFGSRGLTTIPLCADYLAALINQEPLSLPYDLQQAISPARFVRRALLRQQPESGWLDRP